MKQIQLTILLILTLIQNVSSQDKVIKEDTLFWNNHNQEFIEELKLTDFDSLHADFSFRFSTYGQVVEIYKTNNQIRGVLTNYIYHSVKKRNETLFKKIELDSIKSLEIYNIIQKSGVLDLQSDSKIEGWSQGCDGITYIIEHSDKDDYWLKRYWTPSAQDSIPESLIVIDFVRSLSDTLQLSKEYKEFKEELPHRGCYNSGGMSQTCYISNSFGFGYLGSTKLPFGFSTSVYLINLGKTPINLGFSFNYKSDRDGNYDFGFNISKSDLFINRSETNDFLGYYYQKRKVDFVDPDIIFQNHQFSYGLNIKNKITLFTGLNYMIEDKEMIGGVLGISKWLNRPKIHTTLTSSIFEDEIDYSIGFSKWISFNDRSVIKNISIGLNFENFRDYNDINFNLTIWL